MASYGERLCELQEQLARGLELEQSNQQGGAAILIPLVPGDNGLEVLFEVRARHLGKQPGEVCFPGGHIEEGETPRDAAVRETCEELQVDAHNVRVIADLGKVDGPGGMPLWVFVGALEGYAGSCDPKEVDRTFIVPLSWFENHEPDVHRVELVTTPGEGFPWELVPQGRNYPWRRRWHEVPFYTGTNPLIWGFTARMTAWFVRLLKQGSSA